MASARPPVGSLPPRPGWQDQAACRTDQIELFFGPDGESRFDKRRRETRAVRGLLLVPGAAALPSARAVDPGGPRRLGWPDLRSTQCGAPSPQAQRRLSRGASYASAVDTPFTQAQREFLRAQQCGRLLTVGPGEGPQLTTVLYQLNGDVVVAGGVELSGTPAWADVRRCGRAVLVVDEIVAGNPARSRGVRVEASATADATTPRPVLRLRVESVLSWGLEA